MDPKMDSGYLGPGETLEDDYDVEKTLQPDEVLGVMDALLCHEVRYD
jgi:N-alpha-acetyltransferase 35, NatC auxiliary subunit